VRIASIKGMQRVDMQILKSVTLGLVIGMVVGALFFLVSFFTVFSICSDTSIAEVLFPYAFIADPTLNKRALLALMLALPQYPIYGAALGFFWRFGNERKWPFLAAALLLITGHLAVARIANQRVAAMWEERFSHVSY
jgi:hypothetical protein